MKLLFDIGNTRVKWALVSEQELSTQQTMTHAELNETQLRKQAPLDKGMIDQVFVANVAGQELANALSQAVYACWQLKPIFAKTSAQCGVVRNAYAEPDKLGVDRWLALLGAYALAPRAACIVDVGTAMTIDAIDDGGMHLGGLIVPGPSLMMDSLMQRTSDIANFAKWRNARAQQAGAFFASNTWSCVYQGAQHATAALIDAAHAEVSELIGQVEPRLLLTGGAGDSVVPLLHTPVQLVPDLVLRGLAVYAGQFK